MGLFSPMPGLLPWEVVGRRGQVPGQGSGEWPWGQSGSVTGSMFLVSTDLCPLLAALGILTYPPGVMGRG